MGQFHTKPGETVTTRRCGAVQQRQLYHFRKVGKADAVVDEER